MSKEDWAKYSMCVDEKMGIRESNTRGVKALKSIGFVSSLMGGLSIISLINAGFSIGWVEPLHLVIEQYLVITNTFRHVIGPYIAPTFEALAKHLNLGIHFGPRWPDIFLLMIIYLASRIKSYIAVGKYFRAITMFVFSSGIAIVAAYFSSSIVLNSWVSVLIATAIPMLGFIMYDIAYAFVGASFDRGRTPWPQEFTRHLTFSVPLLAFSLFLNSILSNIFILNVGANPFQTFIMIFTIDYLLISGYWIYLSWRHASNRKNRLLGESMSERFWRSSATNVGLNVGIVISSAIIFMLFNAGLQIAGLEAKVLLQNFK